jgi:hypothetical protein
MGPIFLIVGILLLGWGFSMSQSMSSEVKEVFTGSPVDKAMYCYIGGTVLVILGLWQVWRGR